MQKTISRIKSKKRPAFISTVTGQVILVAVAVALLGEIKLYPFESPFRFALGAPAFAFSLLYFSRLPFSWSAMATGAAILIFRSYLTIAFDYKELPVFQAVLEGQHLWTDLLYLHGPASMYYVGMAFCFYVFKIRSYVHKPAPLVGLLSLADVGGNLVEISLRGGNLLTPGVFAWVLIVGILRALMLTGLYHSFKRHEDELRLLNQRKKYEELLLLLTDLHTEAFLLRKSSREIEMVMRRSYETYKNLAGQGQQAEMVLGIAKDVHEIKKDYQRILAGLERILKDKKLEAEMHFSDIVALVVGANESYARELDKDIRFRVRLGHDFTTGRYYDWTSVLNNLVENAVEASGKRGSIEITAKLEAESFVVTVADKGQGIPDQDWEMVFYTGYSTKSDPVSGKFFTGLGLTHARALTEDLGGAIRIAASDENGTTFKLEFPVIAADSQMAKGFLYCNGVMGACPSDL